MVGCGQERDSGPGLSSDQKKLEEINKTINPKLQGAEASSSELYDKICTYSDQNLQTIQDISSKLGNDLINKHFDERNELNIASSTKLQLIKNKDYRALKRELKSNFKRNEKELLRYYSNIVPNEVMYFSYLSLASKNKSKFISNFYFILEQYQNKYQSLPRFYYVARLSYFITESEMEYELNAENVVKQFISKYSSPQSYTDTDIYKHILGFLNNTQNIDTDSNISTMSNSGHVRLSIVWGVSEEAIKKCVDQYERKFYQTLWPFGFYNDDERVLAALEIIALKEQINNFGYLVFLL